jgi:hypothetical protein
MPLSKDECDQRGGGMKSENSNSNMKGKIKNNKKI